MVSRPVVPDHQIRHNYSLGFISAVKVIVNIEKVWPRLYLELVPELCLDH